MIKVYDVQTFYGTKEKTFRNLYNANRYFNQLVTFMGDKNLVEYQTRFLTEEEFDYEYEHGWVED